MTSAIQVKVRQFVQQLLCLIQFYSCVFLVLNTLVLDLCKGCFKGCDFLGKSLFWCSKFTIFYREKYNRYRRLHAVVKLFLIFWLFASASSCCMCMFKRSEICFLLSLFMVMCSSNLSQRNLKNERKLGNRHPRLED